MRRLDGPPESFAVEIAPGVWPQVGVVPAAVFGAIRRGLEDLAEHLGSRAQMDPRSVRPGLLVEGDYVASYAVNSVTRRVTLTGLGRRMDVQT